MLLPRVPANVPGLLEAPGSPHFGSDDSGPALLMLGNELDILPLPTLGFQQFDDLVHSVTWGVGRCFGEFLACHAPTWQLARPLTACAPHPLLCQASVLLCSFAQVSKHSTSTPALPGSGRSTLSQQRSSWQPTTCRYAGCKGLKRPAQEGSLPGLDRQMQTVALIRPRNALSMPSSCPS